MSSINTYILNYQPKDYGQLKTDHCDLDCSLGVNYWPLPEAVMKSLGMIPAEAIKHYPHDPVLLADILARILKRYQLLLPELNESNIHLGCGSFDLLCNINLLYANSSKMILGHAPQFTAYVDHAHYIGAKYLAYPLPSANNYKFDSDEFVSMIWKEHPHLICCENPNNPTGQSLERGDIQKIISAAMDVGAAVVFDEAYGDYLPARLHSAIPYILDAAKDGVDVFVTRTFSKGFGMAGMRLGYAIGPAEAVHHLKKLVTPFNSNSLAQYLAQAMLSLEPKYLEQLGEITCQENHHLYRGIRALKKFHIAETSMYTPICTLYVDNPETNLCQVLADVDVAVISCQAYDNMGKNAVRLMLCDRPDELLERLSKVKIS